MVPDDQGIGLLDAPDARAVRGARVWRSFRRNRAAMAGGLFLVLLVVVAVLAPWIRPKDPDVQVLTGRLMGPSAEHWLGTDNFGRDVLSRLIMGARLTVLAIGQALGLAAAVGIPLGLVAGLARGPLDGVMSRVVDVLLTVPPLVLALAIVGVLGPGLTNAMIAVGIVLAPGMFRVARAAALSIGGETYVEACYASGCSRWRVLWRHVLPNASSPLLVEVTYAAGVVIMAEAGLSFLGAGVQPPQASWGVMLRDAFGVVYESPWFMVAPAVLITLTVLALAVVGDGVRDALEGRGGDRG